MTPEVLLENETNKQKQEEENKNLDVFQEQIISRTKPKLYLSESTQLDNQQSCQWIMKFTKNVCEKKNNNKKQMFPSLKTL